MTEDFVTYDLAVKLKEKGFNEPCYGYYHLNGGDDSFELCGNDSFDFLNSLNRFRIAAPFISQVLKWLRKYKEIYCLPYFEQGVDMWFYAICKPTCGCEFPEFLSKSDYYTYEQAAIAGIEYVLNEII